MPRETNPDGRGKVLNPRGTEDPVLINGQRRVDAAALYIPR